MSTVTPVQGKELLGMVVNPKNMTFFPSTEKKSTKQRCQKKINLNIKVKISEGILVQLVSTILSIPPFKLHCQFVSLHQIQALNKKTWKSRVTEQDLLNWRCFGGWKTSKYKTKGPQLNFEPKLFSKQKIQEQLASEAWEVVKTERMCFQ